MKVQTSTPSVRFMRAVSGLIILLLPAVLRAAPVAASYPGDIGIASDPRVVFVENFEEASLADLIARWDDAANRERMTQTHDVPPDSSGVRSLRFGGSAHLYRKILPGDGSNGFGRLYFRFYVKFDAACSEVHHFVEAGGYNPPSSWPNPNGSAGQRPTGSNEFSTAIDPMGTRWAWDFYTYWMHMRADPSGSYWGNDFSSTPGTGASPYPVARGEWLCVEFMVTLNTAVSTYSGEQAFWINGEKKAHLGLGFPNGSWQGGHFIPAASGSPFEGFQWRNTTALALNYLWLQLYVDRDPNCAAWLDDLVVATEYIGPIAGSSVPLAPTNLRRTDALRK